ncbi:uncharacterized protein LOC128555406 [Mercenaria mercenaria]|uniref:uncharacterized protein LOC128555406 n=1 Tax=Mercenaria mercenaria TaxID=6596 RepID=UPI00234FA528|nr:uncharacterized protein LOC128555406 [Mercenaria mercenaria]
MSKIDKKLKVLDSVEKKMKNVEKEITKIWTYIGDHNKQLNERLSTVEDKAECVDFSLGVVNSKVIQLEKEKEAMKSEIVYLQSQSMRNNLIFENIPEARPGVTEDAEKTVRDFMEIKMKIAKDIVANIKFDRVLRMGQKGDAKRGKSRSIVAKFTEYKEKELTRRQWKALQGTEFSVHEQLPREIVEVRKKLLPKLKQAKKDGKRAWLSYDKLYIDGEQVKVDSK